MDIGIVGAGKWGVALKFILSKHNKVCITSRTPRDIDDFVPMEQIVECDYLVMCISSQNIGDWMTNNFKFKNQKMLVASKGIDYKRGKFLNQVFDDFLPRDNIAFLSGSSFATEVIKNYPTALVVSSLNKNLAKEYASVFPNFIKTYISDDVIGTEIASSYKNVIAIAGGICDGLSLGNNARASLLSRSLIEMYRFGKFFGGNVETFLGLSGAGDLFLTATSGVSRNYRVGFNLAKGRKLSNILDDIGEVAEGILTSSAINKIATKYDIYTPIASEVELILHGKNPIDSIDDLLKK